MDRSEDEGTVAVSFDNVVDAIKETEIAEISEFEITVLNYLSANGPSSIEEKFCKGVGKSRATLQRKLTKLVGRGLISVRSAGTSKNPKQEFYIPILEDA
jgi:predicted transcriptional regulator